MEPSRIENFAFKYFFSGCKIIVPIFFNAKEMLLINYMESDHTITGQYYATLITKSGDCIKDKNICEIVLRIVFQQENLWLKGSLFHKNYIFIIASCDIGFEVMGHTTPYTLLDADEFYLF